MQDRTLDFKHKQFEYNFIEFDDLKRIDGDVRLYETPEGKRYPSVTTVLGKMSDKTGLEAWRKRIGEEEAVRISMRAATRGTAVHDMCENYVLGANINMDMPNNNLIFHQIRKVLDERVDHIRATECTLFSNHLRIAGTCDLVAKFDGKLSIIDYKTSARMKRKEWIENYFLQTSLYSYMLWEMTGIEAKDIVVIIGVDDEPQAQIFVDKPKNYIEKAADLVKSYHRMYS